MTFSSKRKSVSSKTKSLCQGLPYQGSCRADARLRGWTKDAFRVSGITQVLLCTTSPSSSLTLDATSPSRGGFDIPSRFPASPNQFQRKRNLFAKGSPDRKDSPGRGRWHESAPTKPFFPRPPRGCSLFHIDKSVIAIILNENTVVFIIHHQHTVIR